MTRDTRSLREKCEEVKQLRQEHLQESSDDALARRIHGFLETSDDRVSDEIARLQEPVETRLRRKFHLERPAAVITTSQDREADLRRIRRRLRGCE